MSTWTADPTAVAAANKVCDTLSNLAIAHIVIGVLQVFLSFTYVDAALAIALGATILCSSGNRADPLARARGLASAMSCTFGVAIAEIVFAVLSVIIYGAVFFSIGVILIALVAAIRNLQNGNYNLTPQEQEAVQKYCTSSTSACEATKGVSIWLIICFFMGWFLPLVQIILSSVTMCMHSSLQGMVAAKLTPPPQMMQQQGGNTTVVMMPQGMVSGGATMIVPGGYGGYPAGTVVMAQGGQQQQQQQYMTPSAVPMAMPAQQQQHGGADGHAPHAYAAVKAV